MKNGQAFWTWEFLPFRLFRKSDEVFMIFFNSRKQRIGVRDEVEAKDELSAIFKDQRFSMNHFVSL